VRVAVEGDTVGPHLDHLVQRVVERVDGLKRQAVDKVEVHGAESQGARALRNLLGLLARLNAAYGLLHLW
jgi:hypothetical protein